MSPKEKVIPFAMNAARAKQLLREVAKDSSRVFFRKHAEQRMKQRHITRTQVLRCLQHGMIVEGPVLGMKGNWELSVEVISAGDVIRVVAALDRDDNGDFIIVITVYQS